MLRTVTEILFTLLTNTAITAYPDDRVEVENIAPCSEVFGLDAVDPANPTWCVTVTGVDHGGTNAPHIVEIGAYGGVAWRAWYRNASGGYSLVWSHD